MKDAILHHSEGVDIIPSNLELSSMETQLVSAMELINVMADADILSTLSVKEGAPQYLLPARKSPYPSLADRFPIYAGLEDLVSDEKNHIILTP